MDGGGGGGGEGVVTRIFSFPTLGDGVGNKSCGEQFSSRISLWWPNCLACQLSR